VGRNINSYWSLVGRTEARTAFGRPMYRREGIPEIDLQNKVILLEWIYLI
jgi:hypothetical protein